MLYKVDTSSRKTLQDEPPVEHFILTVLLLQPHESNKLIHFLSVLKECFCDNHILCTLYMHFYNNNQFLCSVLLHN